MNEYTNYSKATADVMDGYTQTKRGRLYRSQGLVETNKKYAYFVLENPENSGVDLFLRTLHLTNFINAPLAYEIIYFGEIKGTLYKQKVASANSYNTVPNNEGRVYAGTNATIVSGIPVITHNVTPYNSYRTWPQGSLLIAPGTIHLIKTYTLTPSTQLKCAVSFDWWEEPFCDK